MSILTLPELVEMISTEHDPERRRKIVRLAYIIGETAGMKMIVSDVRAKLNEQERRHDRS